MNMLELETRVRDYYYKEVLPLRLEKSPLSEEITDDFYEVLCPLVWKIIHRNFSSNTNENEREELSVNTMYAILVRLHKGTLMMYLSAWIIYLKRTMKGVFINMIQSRSYLGRRNVVYIDFLDDLNIDDVLNGMGIPFKTSPSPVVILEKREEAKRYLDRICVKIKEIVGSDTLIPLLGFYCYHYGLDPEILPLRKWTKNMVILVSNTFDYYLRMKKPRGIEIPA